MKPSKSKQWGDRGRHASNMAKSCHEYSPLVTTGKRVRAVARGRKLVLSRYYKYYKNYIHAIYALPEYQKYSENTCIVNNMPRHIRVLAYVHLTSAPDPLRRRWRPSPFGPGTGLPEGRESSQARHAPVTSIRGVRFAQIAVIPTTSWTPYRGKAVVDVPANRVCGASKFALAFLFNKINWGG
jgi:hypothetical protein